MSSSKRVIKKCNAKRVIEICNENRLIKNEQCKENGYRKVIEHTLRQEEVPKVIIFAENWRTVKVRAKWRNTRLGH
tara:strand:+ start:422 stop:649 length:228 start_codon:yes stop_codon:yes gene_type:complete